MGSVSSYTNTWILFLVGNTDCFEHQNYCHSFNVFKIMKINKSKRI